MEPGELFVVRSIYRECDEDRSSEADMRGGGEQRPDLQVSELKKTGARSARARTRGQNPLVLYNNTETAVKSQFVLTVLIED